MGANPVAQMQQIPLIVTKSDKLLAHPTWPLAYFHHLPKEQI
jgi:hypothetical protein